MARQGDHVVCPDGTPDSLISGAALVLVNGRMSARRFDKALHVPGGISTGSPDVFVGGETVTVVGNLPASLAACGAAADGRATTSTQQSYDNCGIESARQIINLRRRPPVTEDELFDRALDEDWADREANREKSGGTSPWSRRKILASGGVETELEDPTPEAIQKALAEGKGVITSHDVAILNDLEKKDAGGHAMLVTGVKYDENGKVAAYRVNDTGTGQCGRLVPAERFERSLRRGRPMNVTKERIW